jgi:phosphoglycolate phosphatase-like HAD superfamily hydrolase
MGISGDADELVLETISHFNHLKENGFAPSIYPGAEEALRSIRSRGIDISVLSGHPKSHVVDEARGYGIETLFSRIIGSVKNKSKELLSLLREIPSQSAAYVGDMTYDITSARAAGIMPISVTTGYQNESLLRYENPDLLVGSIAELDTILRNR